MVLDICNDFNLFMDCQPCRYSKFTLLHAADSFCEYLLCWLSSHQSNKHQKWQTKHCRASTSHTLELAQISTANRIKTLRAFNLLINIPCHLHAKKPYISHGCLINCHANTGKYIICDHLNYRHYVKRYIVRSYVTSASSFKDTFSVDTIASLPPYVQKSMFRSQCLKQRAY